MGMLFGGGKSKTSGIQNDIAKETQRQQAKQREEEARRTAAEQEDQAVQRRRQSLGASANILASGKGSGKDTLGE